MRPSASCKPPRASTRDPRSPWPVGSKPWARASSRRTSSGKAERNSSTGLGVWSPPTENGRLPGALNVAHSRSYLRRPISPQDLDRPLHLPKLMRVAADVRMEGAGPPAVGRLDRGLGRPSAAEPGRMHADVLEAEDPERRRNPLRLQVELPEVREDPA